MSGSIYSDGSDRKSNPGWHVEDSPWKAQQVLRMLQRHDIHPGVTESAVAPARLRQLSLNLTGAAFSGFDISADAITLARARRATESGSSTSTSAPAPTTLMFYW